MYIWGSGVACLAVPIKYTKANSVLGFAKGSPSFGNSYSRTIIIIPILIISGIYFSISVSIKGILLLSTEDMYVGTPGFLSPMLGRA